MRAYLVKHMSSNNGDRERDVTTVAEMAEKFDESDLSDTSDDRLDETSCGLSGAISDVVNTEFRNGPELVGTGIYAAITQTLLLDRGLGVDFNMFRKGPVTPGTWECERLSNNRWMVRSVAFATFKSKGAVSAGLESLEEMMEGADIDILQPGRELAPAREGKEINTERARQSFERDGDRGEIKATVIDKFNTDPIHEAANIQLIDYEVVDAWWENTDGLTGNLYAEMVADVEKVE